MQPDDLLEHLAADGPALLVAAQQAGWDTAVPTLSWNVRELVVHTGAVHRWCADIVRRRLSDNETGGSRAFHPELPDDELPGWFLDGHAGLLDELRAAPEDLEVSTFLRDVAPRHFWIRRQAHETAVHRIDAEAAAGAITGVASDFAADGLVELVGGFARGRAFASGTSARLALAPSDGASWLVTFGGERNEVAATDDVRGATATVRGSGSDVYRWAWNRPAEVEVSGDEAVLDLWRRVRV